MFVKEKHGKIGKFHKIVSKQHNNSIDFHINNFRKNKFCSK